MMLLKRLCFSFKKAEKWTFAKKNDVNDELVKSFNATDAIDISKSKKLTTTDKLKKLQKN